ncbi:MAG: nucleotidyl transferase AbiEii/AbiGii toxin family protein, partial [archaeon]
MITKEDIKEYSKTLRMKPWQIEKEYFQHIILQLIYSQTSVLLFKGGTAIKKAYGLKRFSEDLDFTRIGEVDFNELLEKISKELSTKFECQNTVKKMKVKEEIGISFRFDIIGPLTESSGFGHCYIYVEISKRETPKTREIVKIDPVYQDLSDYTVIVMSREEILTEKVRTIFTRDRPRDLYDLWYLLSHGVGIRVDWINEKMSYYQIKFTKEKFFDALKKYEKLWAKMPELITDVPDFKE